MTLSEVTWIALGGCVVAILSAVIAVSLSLFTDPKCPQCRHRDWSKGPPPWRCRKCRTYYWPPS